MFECTCKHCKEVLKAEKIIHMDWLQWSHLRDRHPEKFKKLMYEEDIQILRDNFSKVNY